jgi:hypothetical protein
LGGRGECWFSHNVFVCNECIIRHLVPLWSALVPVRQVSFLHPKSIIGQSFYYSITRILLSIFLLF